MPTRAEAASVESDMALLMDILCAMFFAGTAPFWIYKMIRSKKYRAGWPERFGWVPRCDGNRTRIWIHGVSVGEILAARALVRRIEERHPDWDVVLSTTTLDGHKVAERAYPGRTVFYFPMDFSFMVRRTLGRIRPSAVLLIEQEIWVNFLLHLDQAKVPAMLINGRISRRSFRRYGLVKSSLFRPFHKIRWYCVQTEEYADRFAALGIPRSQIDVTGSMKFDNISVGKDGQPSGAEARSRLGIGKDEWVLMAGSTHASEDDTLLDIYREIRERVPRSRLVLVPRHMERIPQVEALILEKGESCVRKTSLDGGGGGKSGVILVDTMGDLPQIYPAANVVFVGGSLVPVGGHNTLEPASLGLPVITGPYVFKCAEDVNLLVKAKAGLVARDAGHLRTILLDLAEDPKRARLMGEKASRTLLEHQGATDLNLSRLEEVLRPAGGNTNPTSRSKLSA